MNFFKVIITDKTAFYLLFFFLLEGGGGVNVITQSLDTLKWVDKDII